MGRKARCSLRGLFFVIAVASVPTCESEAGGSKPSLTTKESIVRREKEYEDLYKSEADKSGLESIRELHMQLDDDKDGSIEPSETGDFIRGDLKYGSDPQRQLRQKKFHRKDSEVTVNDLWHTWRKSDVHNWTVDQTAVWLTRTVELPQYADRFRRHGVNGSLLPQVAVSTSYLAKVVGIDNAIHRSKIALKAMDVVLFGPPKDTSSYLKDVVLTSLLVVTVSLLLYAYKRHKASQEHLKKMFSDLEGLNRAELELKELQAKLQQKDSQLEISQLERSGLNGGGGSPEDPDEVSRLRAEVEKLEHELRRAEVELEDRCWVAPLVLQHWLQLTYELESVAYLGKKKAAEDQLERAKDLCDKLKKKRSSLVGAFVSTHGKSSDDVDKTILDAKTALLEVAKNLGERTHRWRQVEVLCGCAIMSNPGIAVLQNLVRSVGAGGMPPAAAAAASLMGTTGTRTTISSRLSNKGSHDDLLHAMDDDNRSIASARSLTISQRATTAAAGGGANKVIVEQMSRESSKESSSADEFHAEKNPVLLGVARSSSKPKGPRVGPGGRKMVKSFSQDASHSMATTASRVFRSLEATRGHIHPSASDSQLSPVRGVRTTPPWSNNDATLSNSTVVINGNNDVAVHPTANKRQTGDANDSGSDTASITSSSIDISGGIAVEKKKNRRSFFNFRRSKKDHKKELIL